MAYHFATIENGCPICKEHITGNDKMGYLCKRCKIVFKRKHLKDLF